VGGLVFENNLYAQMRSSLREAYRVKRRVEAV